MGCGWRRQLFALVVGSMMGCVVAMEDLADLSEHEHAGVAQESGKKKSIDFDLLPPLVWGNNGKQAGGDRWARGGKDSVEKKMGRQVEKINQVAKVTPGVDARIYADGRKSTDSLKKYWACITHGENSPECKASKQAKVRKKKLTTRKKEPTRKVRVKKALARAKVKAEVRKIFPKKKPWGFPEELESLRSVACKAKVASPTCGLLKNLQKHWNDTAGAAMEKFRQHLQSALNDDEKRFCPSRLESKKVSHCQAIDRVRAAERQYLHPTRIMSGATNVVD